MPDTTNTTVTPTSPQWKNWSGNLQHDGQGYYFRPTNLAELQAILAQAIGAGRTVRVSGQRHSQPPLVVADDRSGPQPVPAGPYLVDMSCYVDIGSAGIRLGPGPNQVTVNPGVREDDLDVFLAQNDLMFQTVTAGGFFSLGGMTAVDVHGATVAAPIFAETASAFTLVGPDGTQTVVDGSTRDAAGNPVLPFARVSLGALGIVTRITLDVLPCPSTRTLQGGKSRFRLANEKAFVQQYLDLLTGPFGHARLESFYTPYAASVGLANFLALWWDLENGDGSSTPSPVPTACNLSEQNQFGAPTLGSLESYAASIIETSQYADSAYLALPLPPSAFAAIALDVIESEVDAANRAHAELWLTKAMRVMFMSYFIELPALDAAGLSKVWKGLQVVGEIVTQNGNFHIAAPMEFRFVRAGDTPLSGTFSTEPDAVFVNLDLIGFVDAVPGDQYPDELLKFFATVERQWVAMGGLPHNGKMYGFYDPTDPDSTSFAPPFHPNFLSFVTQQRVARGAPVKAFDAYRKARDPEGRFDNPYLQALFAGLS